MKALYIAWQDPETRLWHTVGQIDTGKRFIPVRLYPRRVIATF